MVYQVTGNASLQVQKRTDGDSFDRVLWMTQSPSDSWLIASIDLQNSTEPFQVRTHSLCSQTFKSMCYFIFYSTIMFDHSSIDYH